MKKSGFGLSLLLLSLHCHAAPMLGPSVGVGGSWNTVDETFTSQLSTTPEISGNDHYNANISRFAPIVQIGYAAPLKSRWLWGVSAQWSYPNYKTENVNTSRGQYLPNASFSSINIFGPNVIRDFSSQTRVKNELLLLAYLGLPTHNGYAYLGAGPAVVNASNSIYVSSIHTPVGTGGNLTSGSIASHHVIWGGAAQVGYNYYIEPTLFINANYTYLGTGSRIFTNTINAAYLNGFVTPGPSVLTLHRTVNIRLQQFMVSINKLFC